MGQLASFRIAIAKAKAIPHSTYLLTLNSKEGYLIMIRAANTAWTLVVVLAVAIFGPNYTQAQKNSSSRVMIDAGRYVPSWRGRLDTVYGFSYFTPR